MPLPLPNLDVRRYDDLVAEMRALIPQLAPRWTNHNAADPGITLIELLAWLTEATLYRLNRTPETTYWNLIRLLRPEDSHESPAWADLTRLPLPSAKVQALQWFDETYRAVTVEDFERLVMAREFGEDVMKIARVRAVPSAVDGTMTIVIVPKDHPFSEEETREAFDKTRDAVKTFLDQRRLVGTRVRIRRPIYTAVSLNLDVESVPDSDMAQVQQRVRERIEAYLGPVAGGADAKGWPFGRPVSIHDLVPLAESVSGVVRVKHAVLDGDPLRVESAVTDLPRLGALSVTVTASTPG